MDTRRRCGHADETARKPEEYRTPDGFFPPPDGGTLLVNLGNARLTRIEVDLSFGETWSIAQGAPGTGLAMINPVGTDRTGGIYFRQRLGGMTGISDSVNGPAKLPLFNPIFPLFEHDRPHHGLTARTADRAVLVRLRRFLAAIHVPSEGIVRQAL